MNYKLKSNLFLWGGMIIFLGSCLPSKKPVLPQIRPLPVAYDSADTSKNIASISWKQFFSDRRLLDLIDSTLVNNPDLLVASEQINIAKAQLSLARGAAQPIVNGVVSAAADRYGDYTMNGVGNFDTNLSPNISSDQKIPVSPTPDYFIGLRSVWEIDVWGKFRNQTKAARLRVAATEYGRQFLVTNLVAAVASLYYELLALDNELTVIQKNVHLQQTALELVRVQKEAGRATELAVQQFEAQLLHTQAMARFIRQRIIGVENQINLVAGRYPKHIARDTAIMSLPIPELMQTGVPAELLSHRPDIREAELQVQAASADVLSARAAFLPSLTITPYGGVNAFNLGLLFNAGSLVYGVIGGLTTPVFNQNKIRANYAMTLSGNKIALHIYQKKLLAGYSEVSTTLRSLEQYKASYILKQAEVEALQKALSSANDLYLTGYANYLEVITAQKSVLDAELELTGIKRQLLDLNVDLYHALGGGWNN